MSSPRKPKVVMSLAGRAPILSRFVSLAIDRYAPFFNILKGYRKFEWKDKYEQAFLALKEHLGHLSLLSKPIEREKLDRYLIVSEETVSTTLVKEEEKVPVYYVSKKLLDVETRYPELEKLALALMVTSRKLRSYFNAHLIEVLTNYPLCQVI